MNKEDFEDPDEHLFYCDKTSWYTLGTKGEKDWTISKKEIKEFWDEFFKEKIQKEDYDFSEFIFPPVNRGSFPETIGNGSDDVTFYNSEFQGSAVFSGAQFLSSVNFSGCLFHDGARFLGTKFLGSTYFANCIFRDYLNLAEATFEKNVSFQNAKIRSDIWCSATFFKGLAFFNGTEFSKGVFTRVRFLGNAFFSNSRFENEMDFSYIEFHKKVSYSRAHFRAKVNFDTCSFTNLDFTLISVTEESEVTLENSTLKPEGLFLFIDCTINGLIRFKDLVFYEKTQFQRFNMKNVIFESCDLVRISFSNCVFWKLDDRLVLANDSQVLISQDPIKYKDLSNTYRQLKKNRMDSKDWIDAGDAYRSEMVMKRKLLGNEITRGNRSKIVTWCIMGLYDYLSGYHQSMSRPLAWFVFLLIFSSITLFLLDSQTYYAIDLKWLNAVQTSLNAALPIAGKIEVGSYNPAFYFLLVFVRIFSIILLTFFGLATRSRLRQ